LNSEAWEIVGGLNSCENGAEGVNVIDAIWGGKKRKRSALSRRVAQHLFGDLLFDFQV
jgi:hypothetical protein